MNRKVSVVILNYNNYIDTISCLKSLLKISYNKYEVIVIDNNSPNNSAKYIKDWLRERRLNFNFIDMRSRAIKNERLNTKSKITLIQTGTNKGYGHGNNIGIKYALENGADYVLILNNDTVVSPDFLEPLVEMCEKDKNIGIASGKIYFYDRPDIIWFNGGAFHEWTGRVKHFNFNEKDVGQIPEKEVTFITGCMWLIPKQVFEKVGLINEEYFMYVEDLEFCYRVRKAGYKLAVNPKSKIWHKIGARKGNKQSSRAVYYIARNKTIFFKKYMPIYKSVFAICISSMYYITYFIQKNHLDLIKFYIKGLIDGIGGKNGRTFT